MDSIALDSVAGFSAELFGILNQKTEKFGNHTGSRLIRTGDCRTVVKILKQMPSQPREFLSGMMTEGCQAPGVIPDVSEALDFGFADVFGGLVNQVINQVVDQTTD